MISTEDYLYFLDQALDDMLEIVTRLGDDHVNRHLDCTRGPDHRRRSP